MVIKKLNFKMVVSEVYIISGCFAEPLNRQNLLLPLARHTAQRSKGCEFDSYPDQKVVSSNPSQN